MDAENARHADTSDFATRAVSGPAARRRDGSHNAIASEGEAVTTEIDAEIATETALLAELAVLVPLCQRTNAGWPGRRLRVKRLVDFLVTAPEAREVDV